MRPVFVLLALTGVTLLACGDDGDEGPQASPNNGTTGGATTGGATGGGTTGGTTGATGGGTSNTTTGTAGTAGTTGQVGVCEQGSLLLLSPEEGDVLTPADDVDAIEAGVQIEVRVATDLEGEVVVTVENETLGFSSGVLSDAAESVVSGVPLRNGVNTLTAWADTGACYVTRSVQVTLDGGTSCVANSECPMGELCQEGGFCQACAAECSTDADCAGGRCVQGCVCVPTFERLLIEDASSVSTGNTPGADLDAVGLRKPGEAERFVARVWESNLQGDDNMFNDPALLLGEPDADCTTTGFVSLGGRGGFVMVGFEDDALIEPGDVITVYELGPTLCPEQTGWADEPYEVSVGVSNERDLFVEIGAGGPGQNVIIVPALP